MLTNYLLIATVVLSLGVSCANAKSNGWHFERDASDNNMRVYTFQGTKQARNGGVEAKILWDYSNVRSGNPIRSMVDYVWINCKDDFSGTIFNQTVYAGQMATGRKISFDTQARDASKDENKDFFQLLCSGGDEDYSNVTSPQENEVIDFKNSLPELEFRSRVADQANILTLDSRAALEKKLSDLQKKTGVQFVIATVSSLKGRKVDVYANELFSKWELGSSTEKGALNSVLLLLAPNEGKINIEAGSGLKDDLKTGFLQSVLTATQESFDNKDYTRVATEAADLITTDLIEATLERNVKAQ